VKLVEQWSVKLKYNTLVSLGEIRVTVHMMSQISIPIYVYHSPLLMHYVFLNVVTWILLVGDL